MATPIVRTGWMRGFCKSALLCLMLAFAAAPAAAAVRVALVVGNSAYETISPLRNAANDARLMAETLEDLGFAVVLLVDADRRSMARGIRDFGHQLNAAGADAVGLFFYAGHGVQARGTNYLLPLGSEVLEETDLDIEAVNTEWVLAQMEHAGNDLNIVILDACRNNPYVSSFRSSTRGLARINAPTGSVVAYSAAPGQVASDGDGANSPYTSALAKAMREPGVELLRVFRQVRVAVEAQTGGTQTPWEEQSLRGDFFFSPAETQVAAIDPDQKPGAVDTEGLEPAPEDNAVELAFWNSVKDSANWHEIQAYLDAFPDGTFAALAEIRISSLQGHGEALPDDSSTFTGGNDGQSIDPALAEKGWVGVRLQAITAEIAQGLGLDAEAGALVEGVVYSGPAEAAGIRPGDVIVRFNDQNVTTMRDIPVIVAALRPDLVIVVDVIRNGHEIPIALQIGNMADGQRLIAEDAERGEQQHASLPPDAPGKVLDDATQAESWFQRGEQYYLGRGVTQDYLEAARWFHRAADLEHAEALFSLGYMYSRGEGVGLNNLDALHWFRRAAEQGHARAMGELATFYWEGRATGQDFAQAAQWHRRAADLGYTSSMVSVAILLDEGRNVEADPSAAATYLIDAYARGNEDAERWVTEGLDQWSRDTRLEIQRILQTAGVYTGPLDGAIGPATRTALEAYKSVRGG